MVKCDTVTSSLVAFSVAFLIKLCRRCLLGPIGKMFLDIHCVTYRENVVLSPNLQFDMAPYNETWKRSLSALCEDTQEKKRRRKCYREFYCVLSKE